jgi:hypothetical protein
VAIRIVNPLARPAEPLEVRAPVVFAVEGIELAHFLAHFLTHLGVTGDIDIWNLGSKEQVRKQLALLARQSGFMEKARSLGVVRDADQDPKGAFRSVQGALERAELPVPKKPLQLAGDELRVMVMILPGQGKTGTLEDLCLASVKDDKAMACVKAYFDCLKSEAIPIPTNLSKAKVRVLLASKKKSWKRLGEAAQAKVWPWDSEVFSELRAFALQLCPPSQV